MTPVTYARGDDASDLGLDSGDAVGRRAQRGDRADDGVAVRAAERAGADVGSLQLRPVFGLLGREAAAQFGEPEQACLGARGEHPGPGRVVVVEAWAEFEGCGFGEVVIPSPEEAAYEDSQASARERRVAGSVTPARSAS
ncbi:hypothetical protein [Streptomyces sp. NBC_01445]|uniref:hypothetical protein n=1 Tax=Streptomyces sp. NBC_01445 TaxID=2903869 RepID=UPI003FA3D034